MATMTPMTAARITPVGVTMAPPPTPARPPGGAVGPSFPETRRRPRAAGTTFPKPGGVVMDLKFRRNAYLPEPKTGPLEQ